MARFPVGWRREPARHALAARGVRTGRRLQTHTTQPDVVRAKARIARDIADRFLVRVGGNNIEEIFLIGSRAAGTARHDSDWDFIIVGEGFDDVEEERGMLEWETDVEVLDRYGNVDIIFSSTPPKPEQKAIKVNLETLVT